MLIYTHTHMHKHIHTCTGTHIHINTHIHTHTHDRVIPFLGDFGKVLIHPFHTGDQSCFYIADSLGLIFEVPDVANS